MKLSFANISRRDFAKAFGGASLVGFSRADSSTPIPENAQQAMKEMVKEFRKHFHDPGLSLAVAKEGKLVYEGAFGKADSASGEPVTSNSRFRIASVTKPITSVTIFSLIEQGRLHLDDRVFGPGGVLGEQYGAPPYRRFVEQIKIEHLLTHTCGGWSNRDKDPMALYPHLGHAELIRWTLQHEPLNHPPGKHYAYSNFGYCLLGRVIETVTKTSYPEYVRRNILKPCGIGDMAIAGNTKAERAENEVVYYGQEYKNPFNPYNMNVRRMDSHGGWIATADDLVQFAVHVDGFEDGRSLLKPETIRVMTTGTAANPEYAKGWCVTSAGNWWHGGSLPGTCSLLVRTAHDFCWAALANTDEPDMGPALDRMMWKLVRSVPGWNP